MNTAIITARYLSQKDAAAYLSVTVQQLRKMELAGTIPPASRIGGLVRYDTAKLDEAMKPAGAN